RYIADPTTQTSLYVDSNELYVAYEEDGTLTVRRYVAGQWENRWNGFTGGNAHYPSLFIDQGVPYVSFTDQWGNYGATVAKIESGNWNVQGNRGFTGSEFVGDTSMA